jgi:hypothetical protein
MLYVEQLIKTDNPAQAVMRLGEISFSSHAWVERFKVS